MSYPPPRYDGASGEVSAWVRPGDEEPVLTSPTGGRVHYLATAESTGGLFDLYHWVMGEQGFANFMVALDNLRVEDWPGRA